MKKSFAAGKVVELLRDPPRVARAGQTWIRGTYIKPGDRYEHGWHWVAIAFGELVLVPTRRLRKAAPGALVRCPGHGHRAHVGSTCKGTCCSQCGGPIDSNEACRCEG